MPYLESTVYYFTADGERTLVVWFVDPALNPLADQAEVDTQLALAIDDAVRLAFQMNHHVYPCLQEAFDTVRVIAVDQEYQSWFSGRIRPHSLAPVSEPTTAQMESVEIADDYYSRQEAPQPPSQEGPVSDTCSWPQVRSGLVPRGDWRRSLNGSFLVIDESGVFVFAQWEGPSDYNTTGHSVLNMGTELNCLVPQLDWLLVTVVDGQGVVHMRAQLPGAAVRAGLFEMTQQLEFLEP